ncbi:sterol desaturase family protein, partial [Fulvivirga lutimaris]|uniref:sterol desaturase family protein n=1 Tax=Fulvivirga lutimaris TaxID=1819566 RepID=UPI0012BB99F1
GTLFLWEVIAPARQLPKIKYWKLRGLAFFLAYIHLTTYIPIIWDDFFLSYQLFDLSSMSIFTQVLVGVLIFEVVQYAWHISMHKSDFLFRVSHQVHHSAERIDIPSSFMFSLNDMIGLSLVGSLTFSLVLGLSPQAITITIITITFLSAFQHANINTPRWLGYILQRPESHNIHHAKGIHKYNYTDLPIIDMLFGTFKNPKTYEHEESGFYMGASNRLFDMLRFKDVTKSRRI